MQFVILDLEWNTAYSKDKSRFVNEIIEFGAVKLNKDLKIIDSFSSFVRPQIDKKLRSRVKSLTHITNEDVADADDFVTVCSAFTDWVGNLNNTVLMSWGDMDIRALIDNCMYFNAGDPRIPFVKEYVDLQAYFMAKKGLPKAQQIGLSNAAVAAGIDPNSYVHHRALNDSELSAACFEHVYNKKDFKEYIVVCNEDFYKRILFKPYYISDINDKLIDKNLLSCVCQECGASCKKLGEWKYFGNSFTNMYTCKTCKIKYKVAVQYKKNYNHITMKKTVTMQK